MGEETRAKFAWMDLVWLAFLGGLAVLEPIREPHKQLILAAIGLFQIFERRLIAAIGPRGPSYSVIVKILLASWLVQHSEAMNASYAAIGFLGQTFHIRPATGTEINSAYWPIYFLPAVTAATYFDVWGTLVWATLTSLAYCSFLIPSQYEFYLTEESVTELAIRSLFFFITALVVNRFVTENRRQRLALEESNRRLEQAQAEARRSERLAALGQLSAGLAHELRNPLGIIKGAAETLTKKVQTADPVTAEMAGYISGEVDRMNSLVSRFLDFARPLSLEPRPEPLGPIVDRSLQAVNARWPRAAVEVERHYASELPLVPVDADLCEQVFSNLALNAYEAMGEKGGRLRVSIAPAARGSRQGVEVRFEDSGPGISPELREQIFNPFFTTKKTGVGLGLSIVA